MVSNSYLISLKGPKLTPEYVPSTSSSESSAFAAVRSTEGNSDSASQSSQYEIIHDSQQCNESNPSFLQQSDHHTKVKLAISVSELRNPYQNKIPFRTYWFKIPILPK